MADIYKKMRIQLYDEGFNQLSDRLVHQDGELRNGPKEEHKGPLKVEVCLFEKEDVNLFKEYLTKLTEGLPKVAKATKIKKSSVAISDDPGWREKLVSEVESLLTVTDKKGKALISTQEELIKFLRGFSPGFVFLNHEFLPEPLINPRADAEKWSYMIPCIKEAKNPLNNKYDPNIMFAFQVLGKKKKQVYVILYKDFEKAQVIDIPWKSSEDNFFKKTEMAKFPPYMILEEREKFRLELYKYRKDPENTEFSKFFKRWMPAVDFKEKEEISQKLGLIP
jgi:hypothetical protein